MRQSYKIVLGCAGVVIGIAMYAYNLVPLGGLVTGGSLVATSYMVGSY